MIPLLLPLLLTTLAQPQSSEHQDPSTTLYEVDLLEHEDDLFHVAVTPPQLTEADRFFDFVAVAPGTYDYSNFGRFVQHLRAVDAEGKELGVEQISTNRWELANPEQVAQIYYDIEDTYDSKLDTAQLMPAGGTGIEPDHVLMNTFGVLGYFERLLASPVQLRLEHDPDWIVGTVLDSTGEGLFHADTYRILADSPILMGDLSTTGLTVGDIEVEIFVHSHSEALNAEEILFAVGDALTVAEQFIGFAPVERYVFLMSFVNRDAMRRNGFRAMGALEHSRSSLYTLPGGRGPTAMLAQVIAHEFMHILTPLHLKSEAIANFDYSKATVDEHLWLYEGVTEWSAGMLRLRGGLTDLEEHLQLLSGKIRSAKRYDPDFSLARLSLEWDTEKGQSQYGNIYELGALAATVLDIRLLEFSDGERGLREVFFEFVERYGPTKPFDSKTFISDFVAATDPDIQSFFDEHITGSTPLPYAETFAKLGLSYDPSKGRAALSVDQGATPEQLALRDAWMREL
ncbi:MAG: putative metalloprotease with PDZ domain [Planctomycetota bacterium]|jgi:predicted metalloprotease with PDZ domain